MAVFEPLPTTATLSRKRVAELESYEQEVKRLRLELDQFKQREQDLSKPITELVRTAPEAPIVAPGLRASEADEPLLQENPNRFVLFPLK